ncbi:MAG: hypothetical protein ABJF50_09325 [Paracoccaceae bacterium]
MMRKPEHDYDVVVAGGDAGGGGADPRAYGSIRVMGTAFATGDAAGQAAATR